MNENPSTNVYFFSTDHSTLQTMWPGVAVSFLMHALLFCAIFYTPGDLFKKKVTPSPINVNLVSFPEYYPEPSLSKSDETDASGSLEIKKSLKQETQLPDPLPRTEKPMAPAPSPQPSPGKVKEMVSLKKKTFKTQKVVNNAIKEIEKKVAGTQKNSVAKALEQIEKNLDKTKPAPVEGKPEVKAATPGPAGGKSSATIEKMELYLLQVKEIFNKNWVFSEQIAGEYENLQSIVVCTILPNGNIGEVWFEKRSGNSHLDDSAFKAILKSGPLPPLPQGYTQPYTAGYVFTPSGVK